MAPEVLARASEPFFTTKEVGKGTGLGLSMVYGFLRQSGGEMRIESQLENGTRVDMYLPRSHGIPVRARAAEDNGPGPVGSGSVLVVDDEEDVREAVCAMLQELGYDVLAAAGGEEALRMLRSGVAPDLLFTDIVMTGMSGVELARAARRERPGMKILLSSGYAHSGGDDSVEEDLTVLTKPYDRGVLGAAVREALLAAAPAAAEGHGRSETTSTAGSG
jgi:CheY-like chemotaxis protein